MAAPVTAAVPPWAGSVGPQANPFVMTNVDGTPDAFGPANRRSQQLALLPLSRLRARHSLAQHDLGEVPMRPSIVVSRGAAAPRRERGVVLFVALIVLIIMTLAGLALLRQMSDRRVDRRQHRLQGKRDLGRRPRHRGRDAIPRRCRRRCWRWIRFPTAISRAGQVPPIGRPDQSDLVRLDPVADAGVTRPGADRQYHATHHPSPVPAPQPGDQRGRPDLLRCPDPELGRVDRRRRLRPRRRSSAGDADAFLSHHDPGPAGRATRSATRRFSCSNGASRRKRETP